MEEVVSIDDCKDEFEYYTKLFTLKNKVIKFEVFTYVYINGVLQVGNNFILNEFDQV